MGDEALLSHLLVWKGGRAEAFVGHEHRYREHEVLPLRAPTCSTEKRPLTDTHKCM